MVNMSYWNRWGGGETMQHVTNVGRYLGLLEIAIRDRVRDDRGEGVISMAIAVLIIASIGAALWVVFNNAATGLGNDVQNNLNNVGT